MSGKFEEEVEKYRKELSDPNLSDIYIVNSCSSLTDALEDPLFKEIYLKQTSKKLNLPPLNEEKINEIYSLCEERLTRRLNDNVFIEDKAERKTDQMDEGRKVCEITTKHLVSDEERQEIYEKCVWSKNQIFIQKFWDDEASDIAFLAYLFPDLTLPDLQAVQTAIKIKRTQDFPDLLKGFMEELEG